MKFLFSIVIVFLILGCIEQEPITKLKIPEHPFQIYEFSYDLRKSVKIKSNDETSIENLIRNSDKINIIFNGTNKKDNSEIAVSSFNIIEKLQTFYSYENKIINEFPTYYFENNTWKKSTGEILENPDTSIAAIWFLGPNTGANETSVNIDKNIIYIQGLTEKDLIKASDKFVLIVMGIEEDELK